LGVIQEGAHADMLLADGEPTENLDQVADHAANFQIIIMKAGTIRNTRQTGDFNGSATLRPG
jgi:imidazolonepropionase-like amidohydrolase